MAVVLTIAKEVGTAGGRSESAVPAAYQKVTYTVARPEGAPEEEPAIAQLIEIRVKDFYGTTIPYTRWHKPGDVIVQPILVHGDWTIEVCQDGAVVLEQKGTVN
jgi:hypothetical protein